MSEAASGIGGIGVVVGRVGCGVVVVGESVVARPVVVVDVVVGSLLGLLTAAAPNAWSNSSRGLA